MPPRTRRASAIESNGDQDTAPKKTTRAPRKTAAKARNQRKGKGVTNENSDSSKKRKLHVPDAKKQIYKQRDDLIKSIDNEIKTRVPRVDGDILTQELSSDLASILPWMSSSPALQKSTQSYPEMMLKALDELQGHAEAYDALVKQDTGIRAPNWMRWGQDAKDLEQMNNYGLKMASRIINHVIMPDLHPLPTKPPGAIDVEDVAWDLIEEAIPDASDDTWGKVAQGHLKAFTEVLRLLPPEE
ncbi:60s ribosomal l15 [Fusarium heterosporum]|uniref:60s ribosomal l15 n=1 Tax=Fusarium heterosporum TaxID=42747 RepID=A0A8H5T568_FUSHE|nr:60s ribosomal l15 [Fusarium heterosporum]